MDLEGRSCLVVGAGAVAARKVRSLLECGAVVTVVGERPAAAFGPLVRRGVRLEQRRFRARDVSGQVLVIAATDDRTVNAAVAAAARRHGIPVNAVDDPPNCTFIVPAVVRRGDLTVAVSTGGKSPAAARLVKERIASMLGDEYAALVRLLGTHRGRMKEQVPGQGTRARAWKRMLDEGVLESLERGDRIGATRTVQRCLSDAAVPSSATFPPAPADMQARGFRKGGAFTARTAGGTTRKCRCRLSGTRPNPRASGTVGPESQRRQSARGLVVESEEVRSDRTPTPTGSGRQRSRR
jgi:siroheme synthase-like protein